MDIRIIQIGFNRCGTRSITKFFNNNGLTSLHWENGRLARIIFYNLKNDLPLLNGINAHALLDMEWLTAPHFYFEAYKLFPILHQHYPDAYFFLNTRPRDAWIKSRLKHFDGSYADRMMKTLKIPNRETLITYWERDWDHHHARIRDYFSKHESRFFEFDITTDGPETLQKNIDYDFTDMNWPHLKGKEGWK